MAVFCRCTIAAENVGVLPGIVYSSFSKDFNGNKPVKIHVLSVDFKSPSIEVRAALARGAVGRLRPVSSIAYNNGAVAAVNGTFFDKTYPYLPVGLIVIDKKIVTKSLLNRSAIGVSKKNGVKFGIPKFVGYVTNLETGQKISVWGLNRPRKEDEVIIYTPEYGWNTGTNDSGSEVIVEDGMVVGISDGNSPIPRNGYVISFHGWTKNYTNALPPGAYIEINYKLSEGWENYEQVVTGGPRLLENGNNVALDSIASENFDSEVFGRKARTAVGLSGNNLIFVVVEGKQSRYLRRKRGVTYSELADTMKQLGCSDAIGLDGGGSSTMFVNDVVVNLPSSGYQQGVSNAIIVKYEDN
ncbi:MAG: phosphodiester glycosidase family protein [Candidatus Saganbacteria bacterium]|nr:phosphodiester glycosidase family protein [Candidatus Saganbacteria bacterium]